MIFDRLRWQKRCRKVMAATRVHSYSKIAAIMACSKSFVWAMLNTEHCNVTVENMLLISRIFDINPFDYIVKDEVQFKLL